MTEADFIAALDAARLEYAERDVIKLSSDRRVMSAAYHRMALAESRIMTLEYVLAQRVVSPHYAPAPFARDVNPSGWWPVLTYVSRARL